MNLVKFGFDANIFNNPNWFKLTPSEIKMIWSILSFNTTDGVPSKYVPSQASLGRRAALSRSHTCETLKSLYEKGWLAKSTVGKKYKYTVVSPNVTALQVSETRTLEVSETRNKRVRNSEQNVPESGHNHNTSLYTHAQTASRSGSAAFGEWVTVTYEKVVQRRAPGFRLSASPAEIKAAKNIWEKSRKVENDIEENIKDLIKQIFLTALYCKEWPFKNQSDATLPNISRHYTHLLLKAKPQNKISINELASLPKNLKKAAGL